jgi:hypothetical protein
MEWVEDLVEETKNYNLFKSKQQTSLKIIMMYTDNNNKIIHVKKQTQNLKTSNILTKEELLDILINNKTYNTNVNNSYKLLIFNTGIQTADLEKFTENQNETDYTEFSDTYNNVTDITFKNSIFDDITTLYILFAKRKRKQGANKTTKNKPTNNPATNNPATNNPAKKPHNKTRSKDDEHNRSKTRKVYCNIQNRKTRKFLNIARE